MTAPSAGNPSSSPQSRAPFEKAPSNVSFPRLEEQVLALWERLDAFRESNRRRAGRPEFVFYDGPPFATGTPHYGHLLQSTIKDIVPRYWSMRGYQVERRFGWDCHGLPIESLAQQALGLSGAAEIRKQGVAEFNEQCRSMVQTYVAEWRKTIARLGRWVDFDHDYKTMDPSFMESVWWVFQQLWQKGRVYKAHRIMPYDPVLATPLSNFETDQREVQDPAITVRFKLEMNLGSLRHRLNALRNIDHAPIDSSPVYALAWTTTPWTLPENLALCLGPDIDYLLLRDAKTGDHYVLAKDRAGAYYKKPEEFTTIYEFKGAEIHGLKYEPLFPYFSENANSFKILHDAFVTTTDGTGIVHMAPAYGEDDYRVCRRSGIELVDPLDDECRFTAAIPEYAGQFCKDADKAIIKRLKDEGRLVHQSTIVHSYPFGERSESPLIYRAIDAWYVRVEDMRDKLLANNAKIRWVPEAVGTNRFGNWLKNARDWNISRNRFWGSCIPVWVNVADAKDMICVGSVAELEALSGAKVTDLHKHHVDQVTILRDGKTYKRTPEVLDCWFESGAMPYGQQHYPFEHKDAFEAGFPARFIGEAIDQTRGWFYTLLVLSTSLFDKPAMENVIVTGHILAEDGQKMSKSKKNYPDPNLVLDQLGADALRTFLIDSPVVRGEGVRFSEAGLKEIVRTVVLPYWNALSFFTTYASVDGYDPRSWKAAPLAERPEMDRWVVSTMQSLIRDVNAEMEGYRLYNVVPRLVAFIDDLTNWYIRRTRPRFWKNADRADQGAAFATLYEVLTTFAKVLAPFMPFLTEEVHQRLVRTVDPAAPASVHWCDYPQADERVIDRDLEERLRVARIVVGLGRKLREDAKLKVRQPLAGVTVVSRDPAVRDAVERSAALVADELNVKRVEVSPAEAAFCAIAVKPNFKELGKRAGPKLKEIGAALALWSHAEVARLETGEAIAVCEVPLRLADVLLQRTPVAGSVVASEGAVTVALDTAMTPALAREGLAREFISLLQQARKGAGLEVSDRIAVRWQTADAEAAAAIAEHASEIADEVLATSFTHGDGSVDGDLNGRAVRYSLTKA